MLKYDHVRLSLEKQFGEEINRIIRGDIVLKLLIDARMINSDDSYSKAMDIYNFKITPDMTPRLYKLCMDVKDKLQFSDKIDFFIVNSPEMNAFAIPSNYKENPHRIALNSTIIDKMDEDELRFVVGHEIGHLVTKTYKISQMMRFLFQEKSPNLLLRQKFMFWEKLCELSSDRFGLLANDNIEKSISSFFKLISGLPKNIIDFDLEKFVRQNQEYLDRHINELESQNESHPIPSLRVVALDIFSRSKVYSDASKNKKTSPDKKLQQKMEKVLGRFFFMGNQTDLDRMKFIASSGLIMAQIDKQINQPELDAIIDSLASYLLFPKEFIEDMITGQKIGEVFNSSVSALLDPKKNKGSIEQESEMMFNYLISIALSDNEITQEEIEFLKKIGSDLFNFTKEKIAYLIASVMSSNFQPLGF